MAGEEVRQLDHRCSDCGYRLEGLTIPRCPECGRAFAPDDPYSDLRPTTPGWLRFVAIAFFGTFAHLVATCVLFMLAFVKHDVAGPRPALGLIDYAADAVFYPMAALAAVFPLARVSNRVAVLFAIGNSMFWGVLVAFAWTRFIRRRVSASHSR